MTKHPKVTASVLAIALIIVAGAVRADGDDVSTITHGGDTYIAGGQVNETIRSTGDAFVSARTVEARGEADQDLHVAGLDVSIGTDVAGDIYAAGMTVVVRGAVGQDLTVAGFSIRTERDATTQGNARLFGNSVTIEGPIEGALMVTGRDVIVNAPIAGDVRIMAQTLTFGAEAVISGALTYSTPDRITVPPRVAAEDRVVFERLSHAEMWEEWDEIGQELPGVPPFASMILGFVISLLFFVVLGALMLSFMPERLERLRQSVSDAPGRSFLLGVGGLSVLCGLVPITALTVVGLPFVPVVLLAIVVAWMLGYALGTYSVAMRIWAGFGHEADPSNTAHLLVFAAALGVVALLNFIPFVGWVVNYTLVLLGVGAMTGAACRRMTGGFERNARARGEESNQERTVP